MLSLASPASADAQYNGGSSCGPVRRQMANATAAPATAPASIVAAPMYISISGGASPTVAVHAKITTNEATPPMSAPNAMFTRALSTRMSGALAFAEVQDVLLFY